MISMSNSEYRIFKLSVNNFKLINKGSYSFDSKNLVVLDGPNGYGKTTLFDAIELVIRGKPRKIDESLNIPKNNRFSESPIHRNQEKPILLSLILKDANGHTLEISRTFPPAALSDSIRNNPNKVFEDSEIRITYNGEIVDQAIEEVLGFTDLKLFNVLNYVEQDENTFFLKKNPKEKYKSLASLLGVEEGIKDLDCYKKTIRDIEKRIKLLEDDRKLIKGRIQSNYENEFYNKYFRLLEEGKAYWDNENLEIPNERYKKSILEEIKDILYVVKLKENLPDIKKHLNLKSYLIKDSRLRRIIKNYWQVENLKLLEAEHDKRKSGEKIIDGLSDIINLIKKGAYQDLNKEDNLNRVKSLSGFNAKFEKFNSELNLINSLRDSLNTQNLMLEELKKRRDLFIDYFMDHQDDFTEKYSVCPTCGYDWDSKINFIENLENTEKELFSSYVANNKKLEQVKLEFKENYFISLESAINKRIQETINSIKNLIEEEDFNRLKDISIGFDSYVNQFFKNLTSSEKDYVINLINHRDINVDEVLEKLKAYIEDCTPKINEDIDLEKVVQVSQDFFDKDIKQISELTEQKVNNKIEYIHYIYYSKLSSEFDKHEAEISKLGIVLGKSESLKDELDSIIKEYVGEIIRNISIPFFIYTGKILQYHSLGSGLILDADIQTSEPQIKIQPIGIGQEVSYTLSAGQLTATVISMLLVLNKVYNFSKFSTILIDDPIQTLDEINTHSLVELFKHNFAEKQILISTHEDRYSKFIRSKFESFGLTTKNINMKDLYE